MAELTSSTATPLESVEGLGEGLVEKLKEAGISSVEALADMTPEQLEAIEGIGPKTVEKISVAVNNYFAALEGGEAMALPENEGDAVATGATEEAVAEPEGESQGEAGSEELGAEAAIDEHANGTEPEPEQAVESEQSSEPAEQKE
jgi:N utilization substance protein A